MGRFDWSKIKPSDWHPVRASLTTMLQVTWVDVKYFTLENRTEGWSLTYNPSSDRACFKVVWYDQMARRIKSKKFFGETARQDAYRLYDDMKNKER